MISGMEGEDVIGRDDHVENERICINLGVDELV